MIIKYISILVRMFGGGVYNAAFLQDLTRS
jgi:hypothetical protein